MTAMSQYFGQDICTLYKNSEVSLPERPGWQTNFEIILGMKIILRDYIATLEAITQRRHLGIHKSILNTLHCVTSLYITVNTYDTKQLLKN